MTINSVTLPKVLDYYISPKYKDLLNTKFISGHCEVDKNTIYVILDYDSDLFACLNLYLEKIKKITIGQLFVYEYENDVKSFSGDQDFVIYLEDGAHICKLLSSNIDKENILLLFNYK